MASAREDYITVLPAGSEGGDSDTEEAFDTWRESLKNAQAQGTLRVQRIPLDENENPQWNGQAVSELFSAPIDRYTFEEIVSKIKRDYIRPHENKIAVRLMGVKAGERGLKFNRLLVVERENTASAPNPGNAPGDLLRAVQEMNAQNVAMMRGLFQEMVGNRPIATAPAPIDPVNMVMQMMTAMGGFMAAMNKSVAAPASGGLKEMVETMVALKGLSDDFSGASNSDEGGAAAIIKAATPLAVPLLQSLTEASKTVRLSQAQAVRRVQPVPARVVQNPPPQPTPSVKQNPAPRESATATQEGDEVLHLIAPQLDTLCQLASNNADPAEVADMVLELVPAKYDQQLLKFVESDKFVKRLQLFNKNVATHAEWFEKVRAAILASYEEDIDDADGEPVAPGHPAPPSAAPVG